METNCNYRPAKYFLIISLLLITFPYPSYGQADKPIFEKIDDRKGLSSNFTNVILQDSKGFIWIGTNSGLNKYDGYKSKVFKYNENDPTSISNDWISAIMEDTKGNLWVGTEGGGLNIYNQKTGAFTNFRHDPTDSSSIGSDIISRIFEDSQQRIWIGTRKGLSLLDPERNTFKTWANYSACHPCNQSVTSIVEDQHKNLWIGDEDYGLYYMNTSTYTFSAPFQDNTGENIHFAKQINDLIYKDDLLWIATDFGIALYNTSTEKFEDLNVNGKQILDYHVRRMHLEADDALWVSTGGSGLIHYNRQQGSVIKYDGSSVFSSTGFVNNSISEILIDYSNNLWIATRGGGVNKFNLKSRVFDHHGKDIFDQNSLVNSEVRALHYDENGTVWAGTNNGVSSYNRASNTYKNYAKGFNVREDSRAPRIRTVFRSRNGDLWCSTIGRGLYKFSEEYDDFLPDETYLAGEDSIKTRYINCVFEKEDGVLWFGTDGTGMIEYNTNTKSVKRALPSNTELAQFNILCIVSKSKNEIWAGTDNGLLLINIENKSFKQWKNVRKDKSSLVGDKIRSLYQDESNRLWIGTRTGFSVFNILEETFQQYKTADGLTSDIIFGVLPGIDSNLWLSTSKGLSRLDTVTMTFKNFTIPQNTVLSMGAYTAGTDGELIVGGTAGFTIFHPNAIQVNPFVPRVVITDLTISNLTSEFDIIVNHLDSLVLPYKENNISLEFSALEFTNSNSNEYRYFLEGFNKDWKNYGTKHDLTFTNLNSGTYTLYLKGSNNDGIWNDESTQLTIIILAPWWKTWWAFCIYAILVLATFYIVIYIRTSYLNKQKATLKNLVIERTHELKEKNIRIAEQAKELHDHSENLEQLILERTSQLIQKNNKLAEYAFMTAHNLRVPVANIKGVLQLFEIERSMDEALELIHLINGQSVKLDKILYDMQKLLEEDLRTGSSTYLK